MVMLIDGNSLVGRAMLTVETVILAKMVVTVFVNV